MLCYVCLYSLVSKLTLPEKLNIPFKAKQRKPARVVIGVHLYEAKALAKTLGITTLAGLYDLYLRNADDR